MLLLYNIFGNFKQFSINFISEKFSFITKSIKTMLIFVNSLGFLLIYRANIFFIDFIILNLISIETQIILKDNWSLKFLVEEKLKLPSPISA